MFLPRTIPLRRKKRPRPPKPWWLRVLLLVFLLYIAMAIGKDQKIKGYFKPEPSLVNDLHNKLLPQVIVPPKQTPIPKDSPMKSLQSKPKAAKENLRKTPKSEKP